MKKRNRRRPRGRHRKNPYLYAAALIAALIMLWQTSGPAGDLEPGADSRSVSGTEYTGASDSAYVPDMPDHSVLPVSGSGISVHFLDVGQAGSTLIITDGHAMLIDAGNRDDAAYILDYLERLHIRSLDYLILTHPHEDHIGSAAQIIYEVNVDRVLMPDIGIDDCETAIYQKVLSAVEEKEPLVDHPKAGDDYMLGEASFHIVAPSPEWKTDRNNLNESSLGILLQYGARRFLVYGDGEKACEEYMTGQGGIQADVLAVAHHGSSTSNSTQMLDMISPEYAVISCGVDNTYGLPDGEVLERLEETGASIYRTDLQGTVVIWSDGDTIEVTAAGKETARLRNDEESDPQFIFF